jgi:AraC-like DNA-binding protein
MFYNRGQLYRRGKLSERGDVSDWFAFPSDSIVEATRPHDPAVTERPQKPFIFTHGPTYSQSYLLQRLVVKHIRESVQPNNLYIEETMLSVLNQVLEDTYHAHGARTKASRADTVRTHTEVVQEVKTLLATHFKRQLSLQQIAGKVHVSPYHLCRVFRQLTGFTIHRYLNQIRLRTSLEYVAQGGTTLAELGLELGYSSHSHFTHAFKRTFGTSPSDLQKTASSRRLREMSKILTA